MHAETAHDGMGHVRGQLRAHLRTCTVCWSVCKNRNQICGKYETHRQALQHDPGCGLLQVAGEVGADVPQLSRGPGAPLQV